MDPNTLALPDLYAHLAAGGLIRRLLELAREEDLGPGAISPDGASSALADITSWAAVAADARADLVICARGACNIAGLAAIPDMLPLFAPQARFEPLAADGASVQRGAILGRLTGPQRQLLALERTLLNLLSRLSGIATRTAQHVAAIPPGTRARLFDTRKTTPGLRTLEKYAVRCGGGLCHRLALNDAMLIKDNHLAGIGLERIADFVQAAARRARIARPDLWFVEVEVDSLKQLQRILPVAPGLIDYVLLDNMTTAQMAAAVEMRDTLAPAVGLEVSGNVSLDTIADIALTGVERISSGSITHHAVGVDIGLDLP